MQLLSQLLSMIIKLVLKLSRHRNLIVVQNISCRQSRCPGMSAKGSCQNTKFIIYGKHEICEKEKNMYLSYMRKMY